MKRILLAGLYHETHCFVDEVTIIDDFMVSRGDEIFGHRGDGSTIDGFLEVADREGWEVVPTCVYSATPSGLVAGDVLDRFWTDFEQAVRRSADRTIDAIFLNLHGAMMCEGIDDVEGEILSRIRRIDRLREVPVFGVFDLHANFTGAMARGANGLVCYRENPHTDARESAVRAADLLARSFATGSIPTMTRRNPGIIWPPTGTGTADTPMRDLEALARRIEVANPDIWAVNVVAGFSFSDMGDTGVSFSLISTASDTINAVALEALCAEAWKLRQSGLVEELTPQEALDRIGEAKAEGPAILVEPSDNIGGGAPGNGTVVLRALVERGVRNAGVIINDPEAVSQLSKLVDGEMCMVEIGDRSNRFTPALKLPVTIVSRSDGRFGLEDLNSHLAAMRGSRIDMGPTEVVVHEGITILLTSMKTPHFDLGQWRSQGINPEELRVIVVKAAVAHRRAYDPIISASYTVATPGPCASDPRLLPYRKVQRPIFPLDPESER